MCSSHSHKPGRVHFTHFSSLSASPRCVAAVCLSLRRCSVFRPGDASKKRPSWFPSWIPNLQSAQFLKILKNLAKSCNSLAQKGPPLTGPFLGQNRYFGFAVREFVYHFVCRLFYMRAMHLPSVSSTRGMRFWNGNDVKMREAFPIAEAKLYH